MSAAAEVQDLRSIRGHDVPLFTLAGLSGPCKVVKVHDGDTVHIVLYRDGRLIKLVGRLHGIDTPELRKEPVAAATARRRLLELCSNAADIDGNTQLLRVECLGEEKYGRQLVKLYRNVHDVSGEIDINKTMVDEGHARELGKKNTEKK